MVQLDHVNPRIYRAVKMQNSDPLKFDWQKIRENDPTAYHHFFLRRNIGLVILFCIFLPIIIFTCRHFLGPFNEHSSYKYCSDVFVLLVVALFPSITIAERICIFTLGDFKESQAYKEFCEIQKQQRYEAMILTRDALDRQAGHGQDPQERFYTSGKFRRSLTGYDYKPSPEVQSLARQNVQIDNLKYSILPLVSSGLALAASCFHIEGLTGYWTAVGISGCIAIVWMSIKTKRDLKSEKHEDL